MYIVCVIRDITYDVITAFLLSYLLSQCQCNQSIAGCSLIHKPSQAKLTWAGASEEDGFSEPTAKTAESHAWRGRAAIAIDVQQHQSQPHSMAVRIYVIDSARSSATLSTGDELPTPL